ncbi:MAG: hypothetical protein CMF41_00620 [Legionellales bacterium]|nr:hypothetical protein [Legionellales bacterium]|tara:strand:- start:408 stop:1154 length:747 start_codon:yes stop_codon:yes gene_type:complete
MLNVIDFLNHQNLRGQYMPRRKVEVDTEVAKQRAQRLKCLREMTGLSRDLINKRYNIARGTLQNWESARFGGLTRKGAAIAVQAMQAEGVDVTLDWLLHGLGHEPRFSKNLSQPANEDINLSRMPGYNVATQELLHFRNHNTNSIDMVISDDSMLPKYFPGDMVAGNRRYQEEIESLVGFNCIIQTPTHGSMVRNLRNGDEPGKYHLFALNWDSSISRPILYNEEVLSAAPIIWVRAVSRIPLDPIVN